MFIIPKKLSLVNRTLHINSAGDIVLGAITSYLALSLLVNILYYYTNGHYGNIVP